MDFEWWLTTGTWATPTMLKLATLLECNMRRTTLVSHMLRIESWRYSAERLSSIYARFPCSLHIPQKADVSVVETPLNIQHGTEVYWCCFLQCVLSAVAWDDKWCYFLTRFIIPYDKTSKRAPSKSFATGEDCTVCAYLLSRLCFKRGRQSVTPEKVLALSGCVGPEDHAVDPLKNWKMAKKVRREKKVNEFIKNDSDNGTYLRGTEERNKKALEIITRLHDSDRTTWTQLDELR